MPPPVRSPGTPAVLFVNMGVNVHSGHGRQTTRLARTLARGGVMSLRMDLRGAGDSASRPDGDLPFYRHDAVGDVRAAVDELVRSGAGPIIAAGTCNGAYLAFHALCEDPRIAGAILVNLYCFDWSLTHGGVPYGAMPVRHGAAYLAMLRDGATWRRILTGNTSAVTIGAALVRRIVTRLASRIRRTPAAGAPPLPIAVRIASVRQRGLASPCFIVRVISASSTCACTSAPSIRPPPSWGSAYRSCPRRTIRSPPSPHRTFCCANYTAWPPPVPWIIRSLPRTTSRAAVSPTIAPSKVAARPDEH